MAKKPKPCEDAKAKRDLVAVCQDFYIVERSYEYGPFSPSYEPAHAVERYTRYDDDSTDTRQLAKFRNREDACWYLRRCRGEV